MSSAVPSASPTVVGDDGPFSVAVQEAAFDAGVEQARLRAWPEVAVGAGAVTCFTGHVRVSSPDDTGAAIESLTLEHYPGMTERSIAELIVQARQRFDVRGVRVIHRVGPLAVTDQIVLVAVSSANRHEAFQCASFLMDWLKTRAPFWKREQAQGEARWVDARESDDEAAARWHLPGSPASAGGRP